MLPFLVVSILLTLGLAIACNQSGQGSSGSPEPETPTPNPSPSPITASGTIAYIGDEGHLWLTNPDGSEKQTIFEEASVQSFDWSPDGSLIALVYLPGTQALDEVAVIDAEGNVVFRIKETSSPMWSPDGDKLALQRPHAQAPADSYSRQEFPPRIEVYDSSGAMVLQIADADNPVWSPDATELAVLRIPQKEDASGSGTTQGLPIIVTLATGEERPLSPDIVEHDLIYIVAWHPAGDVIAYRDAIYNRLTGEKVDLPGVPSFWSPDGRLLFMTFEFKPDFQATTGQLWDLDKGEPVIGLDIRNAGVEEPPWLFIQRWTAWTPDSRFLMYLDPRPDRYVFRYYDTVTPMQTRYSNIKGEAPSPAPDGEHVVFMDEGNIWAFRLDGSVLQDIADGTFPAWRPQP